MSTDASMFIHGKQFRHWELYRKGGGGSHGSEITSYTSPGQDTINRIVEEMMALTRVTISTSESETAAGEAKSLYEFKDANEEDVDMM
jgi:hypothetical protein